LGKEKTTKLGTEKVANLINGKLINLGNDNVGKEKTTKLGLRVPLISNAKLSPG
jgi:hypothetical protein